MVIRLAKDLGSVHTIMRVYVGPDADHLALAGTLTMRSHEAIDFEVVLVGGTFRAYMDVEKSTFYTRAGEEG